MAASHTLPQSHAIRKSGVLVLSGYGIRVQVNAGHLLAHDGIADERRTIRLPRVGHGLRRLVIIASDGFITLEALRWICDVGASFVMLEKDGSVLVTIGPVRPSDARLRRAQSLAHHSGMALRIARELIGRKLAGQEQLARNVLRDLSVAQTIASARSALTTAGTVEAVRSIESQAAYAYWSAWRSVPVLFPKNDLRRVPEHWRIFGSRHSPLTGSPRLAVNPPNAMLNYLYALLESETRLALAALGLDPGIGVLHFDSASRDSFVFDVMEAVRPNVDLYVLDWISRETLHRKWFSEQPDGNSRLTSSFAILLTETAPAWGRAVAPIAEMVARTLSSAIKKQIRSGLPPTRLTQGRRREARGLSPENSAQTSLKPIRICRSCGVALHRGRTHCAACAVPVSKERFGEVARQGRVASHSREAENSRAETQRLHTAAIRAWRPSDQPAWLNEEAYRTKIQPVLAEITVPAIATALDISRPYATDVRTGKRVPHPRHWVTLARLAGVSAEISRIE
jgi:CRISPR-associated endonuclease Cas1